MGDRGRALTHGDVDAPVFHGRVQALFDGWAEPVDLVDEQDFALTEPGQEPREHALVLDRGPRGGVQGHAHLVGDDLRERGLAEPRWAVQEHVIEGLGAQLGGLDVDPQLGDQRDLPDVLLEAAGAQRIVAVVFAGAMIHEPQRRAARGSDGRVGATVVAAVALAVSVAAVMVPHSRHALAYSHSIVAGGLLEMS